MPDSRWDMAGQYNKAMVAWTIHFLEEKLIPLRQVSMHRMGEQYTSLFRQFVEIGSDICEIGSQPAETEFITRGPNQGD